jgi:hypothetical protein
MRRVHHLVDAAARRIAAVGFGEDLRPTGDEQLFQRVGRVLSEIQLVL